MNNQPQVVLQLAIHATDAPMTTTWHCDASDGPWLSWSTGTPATTNAASPPTVCASRGRKEVYHALKRRCSSDMHAFRFRPGPEDIRHAEVTTALYLGLYLKPSHMRAIFHLLFVILLPSIRTCNRLSYGFVPLSHTARRNIITRPR